VMMVRLILFGRTLLLVAVGEVVDCGYSNSNTK
jgi:hypothetical protein